MVCSVGGWESRDVRNSTGGSRAASFTPPPLGSENATIKAMCPYSLESFPRTSGRRCTENCFPMLSWHDPRQLLYFRPQSELSSKERAQHPEKLRHLARATQHTRMGGV